MTAALWTGLVIVCSALGVEAVRRLALRHDVMDVPNARSSHARPTPRGGGLALVLAVTVAWAVAAGAEPAVRAGGFALALALVAVVSALDDVRSLSPRTRLVAQGAAAAILLAASGAWPLVALPVVGTVPIGVAGYALAAVWLVGLTNAYNFMDGIDGIAGAQAVAAGAAWAAIGAGRGVPVVALVGAFVAAAALGFLVHNWSPARIFMGDVGAASLGFVFAALPLVCASRASSEAAAQMPLAGLLAVWPFVFDAVFTVVRRARRGERLTEAHRSHLYQRLVGAGWSHRQAAGLYACLACASAACGSAWALGWYGAGSCTLAALVGIPTVILTAVSAAESRSRRGRTHS